MLQGFIGSVYPTFLLCFGNVLFAQRLNSKLIPRVEKEPLKMVKYCQQMMQQKMTILITICLINVVLALIVTDLQIEAMLKLNSPLADIVTK